MLDNADDVQQLRMDLDALRERHETLRAVLARRDALREEVRRLKAELKQAARRLREVEWDAAALLAGGKRSPSEAPSEPKPNGRKGKP